MVHFPNKNTSMHFSVFTTDRCSDTLYVGVDIESTKKLPNYITTSKLPMCIIKLEYNKLTTDFRFAEDRWL